MDCLLTMIYDRKTKKIIKEKAFGDKSLNILYNTFWGGLLAAVLSRRTINKLYGIFQKKNSSVKKIEKLINDYNIDVSEFEKNTNEFTSFNEFITRKLKNGSRLAAKETNVLISPADSCVLAFEIKNNSVFSVKNKNYTTAKLLGSKEKAREYEDGICLIFRLAVYDYHRYCFIDDGTVESVKKINGVLNSVNFSVTGKFALTSNYRVVNILNTENFGKTAFIEIGAMLVGKITHSYKGSSFKKGMEKGYFEFGGSTVVILLKKNMVEIDSDIIENSAKGIETKVKLGEKIGKIKYKN